MAVTIYRWDDASAPVLNGTAGSLIALLDACLVAGYGDKASSGWTKPYTGTNLAAFRMPAGTNQHYIRVNDTTTTYAIARGYETMSDVNTGTGDFPTVAQVASGAYVVKSSTADAVARNWVLACNGPIFYLFVDAVSTGLHGHVTCFGQIVSYKVGDAYGTIIIGTSSTSYTTHSFQLINSTGATISTHYLARTHTQLGTSIACGKGADASKANQSTMGVNGLTYPHPVDGGLWIAPISVHESSLAIRGALPGVWSPLHARPINHLDTFSGTGGAAGKTFLALNIYNGGQVLFETSNTW